MRLPRKPTQLLTTQLLITAEKVIEPISNYNVLVLDQRFRQNSSVSFVNTNVTRNGSFRDANVSALVFDLSTKQTPITYTVISNTAQSKTFRIITAINVSKLC
jgi:hypothetical protein